MALAPVAPARHDDRVARRRALLLGWVALAPVAAVPGLFLVWVWTRTAGLTGWRFADAWELVCLGTCLAAGTWTAVDALLHRRVLLAYGALLLLLSASWPALVATEVAPDDIVTLLVLTGLALPVGLALLGGVGPRTTVVVVTLVGAAAVLLLLAYEPALDPACVLRCVERTVALGGLTQEAARASSVMGALAAVVVLVRRSTGDAADHVGVAVPVAAAVAVGLYVARAVAWGPTVADGARLLVPLAPTFVLAAAVAAARVRTHRSRRLVAKLLADLGTADGTGTASASAWQFALPDHPGAWVDAWGERVEPDRPDVDLELRQESGEIVARRTTSRARPFSRPGATAVRVEQAADRILLEDARSAALLKADARDVSASRRRIVEAADSEARRIERDLHDGAQQTLVGAAMHVGSAERTCPDERDRTVLSTVQVELRAALDALRVVAHGTFPRLVVSGGTALALREEAPPGRLRVEEDAWGADVPLRVAVAAHRLALASAAVSAGPVSVRLQRPDNGDLKLSVEGRWDGSDLTNLQHTLDRVEAVGGTSELRPGPDVDVVEAVFPCES